MRKALFSTLLTLFIGLHGLCAHADDTQMERYTTVTPIVERIAVSPADEISIATQIDLAPHWHVYWKNPGDSGLPVNITWDLPEGFEISEFEWPAPDKISYDILVNYGYYDQVTLLQNIKTPDVLPEGKITLKAKVNMLVCNEICIPESADISIELNAPEKLGEDHSEAIEQARSKISREIKGQFIYSENEGMLHLSINPEDRVILTNATADNLEFFPYDWGIINHLAMPIATLEDGHVAIKHERGDQPLDEIENLRGLLIIKGKKGENKGYIINAVTEKKTISPAVTVNQNNSSGSQSVQEGIKNVQPEKTTWLSALYLALFGGIILNLMPCVFPVLSMKALSLVKMGEKENNIARLHGISYTLGVVLSFIAIGALLIILKEAGSVIGWGFQLQNPIVVASLAYLLFAIGLNLIGFFEFDFGLGNVGNKLTHGNSLSNSFFTGTLATVVATPCTAPFMGAAMGFALTQSAFVSLSIFAALGFGLALPYLLLSFIPLLRRVLPKPGAWMNTFKQLLAFPMFASSIWLIWVLDQQSGALGILLVLLGMLAIAFAVWLSHIRTQGATWVIKRIAIALSLLLAVFSLSYVKTSMENSASVEKAYTFGQSFSQEKLSELLHGDKPVFVEMTAAWCITCKINHNVALNIPSTKTLFQENDIEYLIGDWTNSDNEITTYLDTFGRNGVPLYVFYSARDEKTKIRPEPIILPQVLTPKIVQQTIEQN
ncbi:MAG: protein-disulfide reductase DsbD family protein [Alphaproteobacteria bacterium]